MLATNRSFIVYLYHKHCKLSCSNGKNKESYEEVDNKSTTTAIDIEIIDASGCKIGCKVDKMGKCVINYYS